MTPLPRSWGVFLVADAIELSCKVCNREKIEMRFDQSPSSSILGCLRSRLFAPLDSILRSVFSSSRMSSACPSSRSGHVAAMINDEMLLWGGAVVNEAEVTYFCSHDLIECFNLLTSQWNQRRATVKSPSDLPPLCANAKIGFVQNRDIYQFGGYFKSSEGRSFYWNDFHKLDGSTLQWEKILPNDQSTPSERFDHGLCVLGKKGDEHVVMMGGGGTKKVSLTPEGYQFIPHETCPYEAYNNEVWLFSVRKSE